MEPVLSTPMIESRLLDTDILIDYLCGREGAVSYIDNYAGVSFVSVRSTVGAVTLMDVFITLLCEMAYANESL